MLFAVGDRNEAQIAKDREAPTRNITSGARGLPRGATDGFQDLRFLHVRNDPGFLHRCGSSRRNPVHAALFLVLAFFTAGGIWMLLEAEFLAITLVMV